MRYSIEPKDRIFLKCYAFAKNMSRNIAKNVSGKYS